LRKSIKTKPKKTRPKKRKPKNPEKTKAKRSRELQLSARREGFPVPPEARAGGAVPGWTSHSFSLDCSLRTH
jgi:hypothetical protein